MGTTPTPQQITTLPYYINGNCAFVKSRRHIDPDVVRELVIEPNVQKIVVEVLGKENQDILLITAENLVAIRVANHFFGNPGLVISVNIDINRLGTFVLCVQQISNQVDKSICQKIFSPVATNTYA